MKSPKGMTKAGHVNWSPDWSEAWVWLEDGWAASLHMTKGDTTYSQFKLAVARVASLAKSNKKCVHRKSYDGREIEVTRSSGRGYYATVDGLQFNVEPFLTAKAAFDEVTEFLDTGRRSSLDNQRSES